MAIKEIDQLKILSFEKQLAFAYLTCERLYPNYLYFSTHYDFGNPLVLKHALDFLHDSFFENQFDNKKIDFSRNEIYRNTPDPGEFATILASSALDACTALRESLAFLKDKKFSRIIDISTFATDSVSMYVENLESLDFNKDKDFRKKIDNHPLVKKEIEIQSKVISILTNIDMLIPENIQTLLNFQHNNKKGSLNL